MLRALVLLLILAACAAPQTTLDTTDSGLSGRITDQVLISDHPHHVLMGHVLIASRGAEITRALVIQQRRDGVHTLRIRQAWQQGRELPYRSLNRRLGCIGGQCRDNAVGFISFSGQMLERAARDGFSATLIGPEGVIEIAVPPQIFAQALAPP
jgi:hypothetical protein